MLLSILSLLIIGLVIVGIIHCIRVFWAWLGRGSSLKSVKKSDYISAESLKKLEEIQKFREDAQAELKTDTKKGRLSREQLRHIRATELEVQNDFLDHLRLGWYQLVMIFFIGSILGLVLEEVWMFITAGVTERRVGLVWGPFSPLYGVGAILLTWITFEMRKHGAKGWMVFLVSMLVGGLLEQCAGWAMETFMGAVSWDYIAGGVPGAITKWVALPFLVFWGLLGYLWYKFIMPTLLVVLGVPTTKRKAVFVTLLSIYLIADITMTLICFDRRAERDAGIPPANAFEEWVDENYSNEFMSQRFQNMVINGPGDAT